ncbi:hypothetical protein F5883DRAFT_122619 [Diaporthe sp. PMI_573]|nr:hypothetical protein F5883DRAFT_122619 [Diaporthaceae sp. PMI_573]
MTNNFASRHMEHIAVLTKQLHECQIGSELTPMVSVLQSTVTLQVSHTKVPGKSPVSGFEEVLRSLPIHEIKNFVDGIQMLMERAKSLQDLILTTERENERRRAEARIKAERQASEQRIRELEAENARLKAVLKEQQNNAHDSESQVLQPAGVDAVKRNRMPAPKSSTPTPKIKPSAAVAKDSFSKLPGVQRDFPYGERNSGPADNALEDSIGTPGSPGEEIGFRPRLKYPRKRPPPPSQEPIRRSKRQTLYPNGLTGTSDPEEEEHFFPERRDSDHTGSPAHLDEFIGDFLSAHEDKPPDTWSQKAEEPYHFGSSPMSGSGTSGAAIPDGQLPDQTGHPSAALALDTAPSLQSRLVPRERASRSAAKRAGQTARATLNPSGMQADAAPADIVEQELKPEKHAQQLSGSVMTTQELRLVENMEQMQGVVEKLSLLLEVGQHAIGAHKTDVMSTVQS